MFIGHIVSTVGRHGPIRVLDLCGAPGGKSTLISSLLGPGDLLVANEIIKTRVPVLADNLSRWGPANAVVTNNDPAELGRLTGFFDMIVVDAPCSGSGMFRKDPDAVSEWSPAHVGLCQQRQQRILAAVYPALKQDGCLIYSTCSYSSEENEQVLDWLCDTFELESLRLPLQPDWGIIESSSSRHQAWGYRFYPDKVKGEGFFAACLIKKGNADELRTVKSKRPAKPDAGELQLVRASIAADDTLFFFKIGDDWLAFDRSLEGELQALQQYAYIKKSGIRIGRIAGKQLLPDHELALSLAIDRNAFHRIPLDRQQAISYLKRETLNGLGQFATGWSLMEFEGFPLGWAKVLPNRINSYFPKEIRILSRAEG